MLRQVVGDDLRGDRKTPGARADHDGDGSPFQKSACAHTGCGATATVARPSAAASVQNRVMNSSL